jgi:AcrR family transcriptional regulator
MDDVLPLSYTGYMATVEERPLRKDAERNRQRILDAAAELFTDRGLGVTLNDIAHHADVGVGTVYRRFPNKELLIDALFEQRFAEFVELAEKALEDPDPWNGLTSFLTQGLELQARDKGLKQLLLGTPEGCGRVGGMRERMTPLVDALVSRARDAGSLRPDIQTTDIPILQWMVGAVVDHGRDVKPELWRRYFELLLRGLRAEPSPPTTLSVEALTIPQLEEVMDSGALVRR